MKKEQINFGAFIDVLSQNDVFITSNTECKMIRVGNNKIMIVVTCDSRGHEIQAMYGQQGKIKAVGPDMAHKIWLACKLKAKAMQHESLKKDAFNKRFR